MTDLVDPTGAAYNVVIRGIDLAGTGVRGRERGVAFFVAGGEVTRFILFCWLMSTSTAISLCHLCKIIGTRILFHTCMQ